MADMVKFTIDGKEVEAPAGELLVDAAKRIGINIPVFCSHPKLDPLGACRMCLVEIEGRRGRQLVTSCTTPVSEGLVVYYDSERAREARAGTLELLLINHPLDCPICDKGGECPLQEQTMEHGSGASHFVEEKHHKNKRYPISDWIILDQERCVVCWRCIRYLDEWEDKPQLGLYHRGGETVIDIAPGHPLDAKTSGNIVELCPVGALTSRVSRFSYRPWELSHTDSICTHCALGCNVRVDTRLNQVKRLLARNNPAVNDQWLCDKGRFAFGYMQHEARLTQPLVRKNGTLQPASWDEALDVVTAKLVEAAKQPQRAGAIGSAKVSNEANYLLQKFFRQYVHSNNVDFRHGGDIATAGRGIPSIAEFEKADLFVLFGVDMAENMPVLDLFLKRAVNRRHAKVLLINSRRVEDSRYGMLLQPAPGEEVLLLNGLSAELLKDEAIAKRGRRLSGYKAWVADMVSEPAAKLNLSEADFLTSVAMLRSAQRPLFLYGEAVAGGAAGVANVTALTNLALLLGAVDRVGYLPYDANAQGARDMGVLPDRWPGQIALDDEAALNRLQRQWGGTLLTEPGMTYNEMLRAAAQGDLDFLYVMGSDPAAEGMAAALQEVDFLVVSDLFLTETAKLADVVLPAADYVESDGTFTNVERRVQRAPKVVRAPGHAAPDWLILTHLAQRWPVVEEVEAAKRKKKGHGKMPNIWSYSSPQDVLQEIARVVPLYDGLTWEALGDEGKQWPAEALPLRTRLQSVTLPTLSRREFTHWLIAERVLYDAGQLFATTAQSKNLIVAPAVRINPHDLAATALTVGQEVQLTSPHGVVRLPLEVDENVSPGTLFVPLGLAGAPAEQLLDGHYGPVPVRIEVVA